MCVGCVQEQRFPPARPRAETVDITGPATPTLAQRLRPPARAPSAPRAPTATDAAATGSGESQWRRPAAPEPANSGARGGRGLAGSAESAGAAAKAGGALSALRRLPASPLPSPGGAAGRGRPGALPSADMARCGGRARGPSRAGRAAERARAPAQAGVAGMRRWKRKRLLRREQQTVLKQCGCALGTGARLANGSRGGGGGAGAALPLSRPPARDRAAASCTPAPEVRRRAPALSLLVVVPRRCQAPCVPRPGRGQRVRSRAGSSVPRRVGGREGCRTAPQVSAGGQSRGRLQVRPLRLSGCRAARACRPRPRVPACSNAWLSYRAISFSVVLCKPLYNEREKSSYRGVLTAAKGCPRRTVQSQVVGLQGSPSQLCVFGGGHRAETVCTSSCSGTRSSVPAAGDAEIQG